MGELVLTRRERLLVALPVVFLLVISGVALFVLTMVGVNPQNPTFFGGEYEARWEASGGFEEAGFSNVSLSAENIGSSKTVSVIEHDNSTKIETTRDGYILENEEESEFSTIFWIPFKNMVEIPVEGAPEVGSTYKVKDSTGLIGEENENYVLSVDDSTILWSDIYSSQGSYIVSIRDSENKKVASGFYDLTSGLLFRLETHEGGYKGLNLQDTTYMISRNRRYNFEAAVIIALLIFVAFYWWSRKLSQEKQRSILTLLSVGFLCVLVDLYIDIWFFEVLNPIGMILLHLAAGGILFYLIKKWSAPAFVEIIFAVSFAYSFMGGSFQPQWAFFPGLFLSWLSMLFIQNYEKVSE